MIRRVTAALLALGIAGVHAWLVPEHLAEMPYIGVLFAISVVVMVAVAAGLLAPDERVRDYADGLGVLASLTMIVLYVISRTAGLPGGYHEGWDDPYGTASLFMETAYVAVAMTRLGIRGEPGIRSQAG